MNNEMMEIPLPMPTAPSWQIGWTAWEAEWSALFADMRRTRDVSAADGGDVLASAQAACERLTGLPEFHSLNDRQRQIVFLSCFLHDVGRVVSADTPLAALPSRPPFQPFGETGRLAAPFVAAAARSVIDERT